MQKFGNLDKWRYVEKRKKIRLGGPGKVRLEVVTPFNTEWYELVEQKGENGQKKEEARFLTVTTGRDVIEFVNGRSTVLYARENVRIYCAQDEIVHIDGSAQRSFTKIATRAPRNPELELIAKRAAENVERRMMQMQLETERRHQEQLLQREWQIARLEGQIDAETGEIIEPATEAGDGSAGGKEGATARAASSARSGISDRDTQTEGDKGRGLSDSAPAVNKQDVG